MENYFTDSLHYRDSCEATEEHPPEDPDSGNKADVELEPEDECLWELNSFVMRDDKISFVNTADDKGKWVINEDLYSPYFSVAHSELVKSENSDDIGDDPVTVLNALP